MERRVSMCIIEPHTCVVASPSPTLCLGSDTLCKIETLLVTFGWQCCISATAANLRRAGCLKSSSQNALRWYFAGEPNGPGRYRSPQHVAVGTSHGLSPNYSVGAGDWRCERITSAGLTAVDALGHWRRVWRLELGARAALAASLMDRRRRLRWRARSRLERSDRLRAAPS
jgi:hypothetical protein